MILWSLQLSSPFMKSLTYGNLTLDVAQDRILVNVYLRVHSFTEDKGPSCNVYGSSSLVLLGQIMPWLIHHSSTKEYCLPSSCTEVI